MSKEETAHQRSLEFRKALHDYFKHMATLSTGSILLIVTFLEKLSKQPRLAWLVGVAIGAFAICVVATIIAQIGNIDTLGEAEEPGKLNDVTGYGLLPSWIFFLAGILSMVVFGVANSF